MKRTTKKHGKKPLFILGFILLQCTFIMNSRAQSSVKGEKVYHELYRPQYHYTPPRNWNNDPNGLVYYKGEYNLYYQDYPEAMEWGPMHWGHAVSTDMLHWKNLPIALYPDSLGYIFSGSAVVDENNTAGFQKGKEKTLVAIFTYHNPKTNVESQAIAYSNDKGLAWKKYAGNPVIPNPGLKDFRDPKVRWYAPLKKWMMVVSCHDHVAFYSSPNLKDWTHESDFGKNEGSHGGVWECPDLFPLKVNGTGEEKWILTVNSGGSPADGRSTQYFIGTFNGYSFTADDHKTRWLDDGADEYAGVTWSNTGNRTIFMGWIDNWPAANKNVPSYVWRGGMTLPMELHLIKLNDTTEFVTKGPVRELKKLEHSVLSLDHIKLSNGNWEKSFPGEQLASSVTELSCKMGKANLLTVSLENNLGEHVDIGYNKQTNRFFIDRTHAGKSDFRAESAPKHGVDIPEKLSDIKLTIFYDHSTLEVFMNDGRWLMTDLVFPLQLFNKIKVNIPGNSGEMEHLKVERINSVW